MRILCLGAAMSYSIRLFKHDVTSGAITAHVLGGVGVVWSAALQPHLEFGSDRERLSDGSALGTRGFFVFLS